MAALAARLAELYEHPPPALARLTANNPLSPQRIAADLNLVALALSVAAHLGPLF
jgi:hypothetical protein